MLLGAGALGNEVAKNMALMGLGYMLVADMDRVSLSNLSRAVFFRKEDVKEGRYKSEIVAERARAMNVTEQAFTAIFQGDIVWQLGGGVYRRVDVVLGCLDNIEARLSANENCLLAGTPLIDGGIAGLAGNVTAVHAPATACWSCTTSAVQRANATNRYESCTQVMLRDIEAGRLPTVQVASSIIAGFQAEEAVKVIQGKPWAAGSIIQYNANGKRPDLDVISILRRMDCWCNQAQTIEHVVELPLSAAQHTLQDLISALEAQEYSACHIALPARFITTRLCTACQQRDQIMQPLFTLDTQVLVCPSCGAKADTIMLEGIETTRPEAFQALEQGEEVRQQMLSLTLLQLGFPLLALVWFTQGDTSQTFELVAELSADAATVMGGELYTSVRSKRIGGRETMTRVLITFVADDGSELDAEVDESWKAAQVVQELIQRNFLSALSDHDRFYLLTVADAIAERRTIDEHQTLAEAGVRSQDRLLISIVSHVTPETAPEIIVDPLATETFNPHGEPVDADNG